MYCLVSSDPDSSLVAQSNIGLKHSVIPSLQLSKLSNKNKLKKIERHRITKNIKQNYICLSIFHLTVMGSRLFQKFGAEQKIVL